VLPTGGTARYASALSVDDFIRKQSIISYSKDRLAETGASIAALADAEDLQAHAEAIRVRLRRFAAENDADTAAAAASNAAASDAAAGNGTAS
jgi:histidinol dehydrogenase